MSKHNILGPSLEAAMSKKCTPLWLGNKSRKRMPEKMRRKSMEIRKKVRKIETHSVFPMIHGPRGPKSRPAKGAGAEPPGQMKVEKLHGIVAVPNFQVKM